MTLQERLIRPCCVGGRVVFVFFRVLCTYHAAATHHARYFQQGCGIPPEHIRKTPRLCGRIVRSSLHRLLAGRDGKWGPAVKEHACRCHHATSDPSPDFCKDGADTYSVWEGFGCHLASCRLSPGLLTPKVGGAWVSRVLVRPSERLHR